jgi:hypothetical protein
MFTGHEGALKYSLQALAQPAHYQLRLLNVWSDNPSELPERLVQAHRHVTRAISLSLTNEQRTTLVPLFEKLKSFSGPKHAAHWREAAFVESSHREDVRQ